MRTRVITLVVVGITLGLLLGLGLAGILRGALEGKDLGLSIAFMALVAVMAGVLIAYVVKTTRYGPLSRERAFFDELESLSEALDQQDAEEQERRDED